jgi:hypothetical protein
MNTGQVLMSVAAFVFLGTVLVNFNNLIVANNDDMSNSHDVIVGSSISATYLDMAQGLNYDELTVGQPVNDPSQFTSPYSLGPDPGEVDISQFDDFDDFNGYSITQPAEGNNGVFRSDFTVTYVDPDNINSVTTPTYLKRLDVKTWRVDVPFTTDTVRMFTTMAYYKYN